METRETIKECLVGKIRTGEVCEFAELFTAFIFAGGSTIPNYALLEYLKYLFEIATKENKDDLALAVLKKIQSAYHIIEEEAELKKEHWHMGEASERADSKFFEFATYVYPTIAWENKNRYSEKIVMQKTRFQILEYASRQWVQEMTDKSYAAFRFLIKAIDSQEKKEILDKILRPRIERWFSNIGLIEEWLMDRRAFVPYDVQQLLTMARAKLGGPKLARQDISNSILTAAKKSE